MTNKELIRSLMAALATLVLVASAGCVGEIDQDVSGDGDGDGDGDTGPDAGVEVLTPLAGTVVEFDGAAPMAAASVSSEELTWNATTDDLGAFETAPILEGTVFSITATFEEAGGPIYRTTVNPTLVSDAQLTTTEVYVMKSAEVLRQANATGEPAVLADAIVVVELLKGDGTPREGVPLDDITLIDANGVEASAGPYVLGPGNLADPNLEQTTAVDGKAQVIFFNVPDGTHTLTALYPQNDGGDPQPKTALVEAVNDGAVLLRLNDPALPGSGGGGGGGGNP